MKSFDRYSIFKSIFFPHLMSLRGINFGFFPQSIHWKFYELNSLAAVRSIFERGIVYGNNSSSNNRPIVVQRDHRRQTHIFSFIFIKHAQTKRTNACVCVFVVFFSVDRCSLSHIRIYDAEDPFIPKAFIMSSC